ncbi:MAG TPA: ERF family protein [Mycobacterium sp.]|uniref:ERF family protein n=1 Tax=Mycobacterium sp. TaxID=1785 RepID=UPI002D3B8848|nr:ERF family protein [Mycobacterium sp.]HZU46881.1 ERF family protein [Mycobacterium sp.]
MTSHSDDLNELAAALAKTQSQLHSVTANEVGQLESATGERSYRYATLSSIWDVVRKPLTDNGLAVLQTCEPGSRGELRLTTTLLHQSGQWVSGTELMPLPVLTPQGYGSALTYARRYGLAALLGVCVDDDDDDGTSASRTVPARVPDKPNARPPLQVVASTPRRAAAATGRKRRVDEQAEASAEAWRRLPYNQAKESDLKLFAQAYARARGLDTVTSDDIRRDFGIVGKLVDYFGSRPLDEILADAGRHADGRNPADSSDSVSLGPRAVPSRIR